MDRKYHILVSEDMLSDEFISKTFGSVGYIFISDKLLNSTENTPYFIALDTVIDTFYASGLYLDTFINNLIMVAIDTKILYFHKESIIAGNDGLLLESKFTQVITDKPQDLYESILANKQTNKNSYPAQNIEITPLNNNYINNINNNIKEYIYIREYNKVYTENKVYISFNNVIYNNYNFIESYILYIINNYKLINDNDNVNDTDNVNDNDILNSDNKITISNSLSKVNTSNQLTLYSKKEKYNLLVVNQKENDSSNNNINNSIDKTLVNNISNIDEIKNMFDKLWKIYPRKINKVQAQKTFTKKIGKLKGEKALEKGRYIYKFLMNSISLWKKENRKLEMIPHFSSWLNANIE